MIDKIKKEIFTGCDACFNVCPENCIEMIVDDIGFRYPKVNYAKCTNCKVCIKTCPSLNKSLIADNWREPKVFAAWSLNESIRLNSTSGGIFSELAKEIILDGGLVVGARYNEQHLVEHDMIESIDDIEKLRQSKYVQSDIGDIFIRIEVKLKEEKLVAFCGSPCQVAGLLNYLKRPYDTLVTFDFVCRGINSPKAYTKYMEMLEKKYNSEIEKVWFKNKTYGWNRFSTRIDFKNGKTYIKDRYSDLYMRGYIEENLYMRPCCFDCKYKDFPRVADITLADFWGVGATDPELDADKGTSLIMINSKKGDEVFNKIEDRVFRKESKMEAALPGNMAIVKSAVRNPKSEEFLIMLDMYPFDVCFKKYAQNTGCKKAKNKIYRMGSRIKRFLKSEKT